MTPTMKYGIILGISVAVWTFVMGFTGWYIHPQLLNLFWAVVFIQMAVLFSGLRATAVPGSTYWGQVRAATMMSLIGGVIIFLGSVLFTTVVFPGYFSDLRSAYANIMRSQGMNEQQIAQLLAAQAATQTTFWQALFGFIGTVVTGILVGLIQAAFIKPRQTE